MYTYRYLTTLCLSVEYIKATIWLQNECIEESMVEVTNEVDISIKIGIQIIITDDSKYIL